MVASAKYVTVTEDSFMVELADGRTITVPTAWYPRLVHGTLRQRNNWKFIGVGAGIHWPDLDQDVSVDKLLAGKQSGESQQSFRRWLEEHKCPKDDS